MDALIGLGAGLLAILAVAAIMVPLTLLEEAHFQRTSRASAPWPEDDDDIGDINDWCDMDA